MNNYLEKFKQLPRELRNAVSSEEKVEQLEEIEAKYNLKLAKLVVRLMIKDIAWSDLEKFLEGNFNLTPERANELKKELEEKIFNEVLTYLQKPSPEDIPTASVLPSKATADEVDFRKISQEVKNILKETITVAPTTSARLEKIVEEIKQKLNLVFEDKILEKRFESVISSYLKEIRNEVQTEETLKRAKKIGGLEFSPEEAALIMRVTQEYKKKLVEIHRNMSQQVETKYTKIPPPEEDKKNKDKIEINKNISFPSGMKLVEAKKPPAEEVKPVNEELQKRFENGPITPSFKKIEEEIEAKKQTETYPAKADKIDKNKLKQNVTTNTRQGISIQIKQPIKEEKLVGDIREGTPRAIGPVEELAEITLTDFQRWGGGQKTTQIILDKINLLQEISLLKRAEGIYAWRRSPLHKLYLEIGQQALEQKKSIQQVIQERRDNNQPFITMEDFEAINELNRKLRF